MDELLKDIERMDEAQRKLKNSQDLMENRLLDAFHAIPDEYRKRTHKRLRELLDRIEPLEFEEETIEIKSTENTENSEEEMYDFEIFTNLSDREFYMVFESERQTEIIMNLSNEEFAKRFELDPQTEH